jgi:radical SAM protein with 4Fe4S-binding SPASM domain
MTSGRFTCRCSTWRWRTGTAHPRGCAPILRHAAWPWRWSTPAICTRVTISWSPASKLGNIRDKTMIDLITSPQQAKFGLAKRDTLPGFCRRCDVRFACHAGCPKDRFTSTPDGEPGLHYLCPRYKAFSGHIRPAMEAMCGLLRAGEAPSQITDRYAKADAQARPQRVMSVRLGPEMEKCDGVPGSHLVPQAGIPGR